MSVKAKEIKNSFSGNLVDIYQRLDEYVISPENILNKQKDEEENAQNILQQLDQPDFNQPERHPFEVNYPHNRFSPPHRDQQT